MGAPALCATAALRSGVGLVKIATQSEVIPTVLAIEPGATAIALANDWAVNVSKIAAADLEGRAVLAVGPGIGRGDASAELVNALVDGSRPVVLDADGLNLLADRGRGDAIERKNQLVMTPHPGEFRRLAEPLGIDESPTDESTRPFAAAKLAKTYGAVVVLKGHRTVVTDGDRVYTNQTGNPAMATAGSGDVLTGCVSALVAQGMNSLDAAILGVYLHGLAGDLWAQLHGTCGLTAMDLCRSLPDAFNKHRIG